MAEEDKPTQEELFPPLRPHSEWLVWQGCVMAQGDGPEVVGEDGEEGSE